MPNTLIDMSAKCSSKTEVRKQELVHPVRVKDLANLVNFRRRQTFSTLVEKAAGSFQWCSCLADGHCVRSNLSVGGVERELDPAQGLEPGP